MGASFDLDVGVERRGELAEWLALDPLVRLEKRLAVRGVPGFDQRRACLAAEIARALEAARRAPVPAGSRAREFVTAEAPVDDGGLGGTALSGTAQETAAPCAR